MKEIQEDTPKILEKLTRLQKNKLMYLDEKGGVCSAITLHVDMPDGGRCTIDRFGRAIWSH